ncbi:MAG: hypothetical protein HYZ92_06470 [Candidatus Omnitrophica bacterium]|nr:hypothetical protein [Candidatus Omnitrophota bacterium]
MKRAWIVVMAGALAVGVAGCSAMSPTQIGQTTGSIAGGAIVPGIGVPLGALVGTLAGLVVERQMDKGREQKERVELTDQLKTAPQIQALDTTQPPSGPATRVWVDEAVQQGRLIAGHFDSRVIP